MEWFILLFCIFGIALWAASRRIGVLEEKVRRLEMDQLMRPQAAPPPPPPPPGFQAQPLIAVEPEPPPAPSVQPWLTSAADLPPAPPPAPQPPPIWTPPPAPQPSWRDRLREKLGDEEWEALLGGSLLNKLGALVLVVGLSLLLGYSFTHLGPAGRVAVSLTLSGALLGGGLWMERNGRYRVFSYGLVGAGWAGLYVTSYAMYALDSARVITNETLGTLLQLAVATAMIGHSLKYASQSVTGVAAAAAFAALGAAPSKQFGVGGLVPLAAALLYVVRRMRWHAIGLFCLIATYGIIIARGEQGSPLVNTQTFLLLVWLMFEAFDLAALRDPGTRPHFSAWVQPLNAGAFVVLSALKWNSAAPDRLHQFLAGAALLFLADAVLRGRAKPEAWRISLILSSGLSALAIVREAGGAWAAALLGIEAELLFLAAWRWRLKFAEWLAAWVFLGAFARLVIASIFGHTVQLGGVPVHDWTPAAVLLAALCYVNHSLRTAPVPYSWFGSGAVQLVIGAETKERWLGLAWSAWALVQLELALWRKAADIRRQACVAGLLATAAMIAEHIHPFSPHLAPFAGAGFWMGFRLWSGERRIVSSSLAFGIAAAASLGAAKALLPDVSVALAWAALALLLAAAALWLEHTPLRYTAHTVALCAFARLFVSNFTNDGATWRLSHRLLTVVPVSASFVVLWVRTRARLYLWAAAIALAVMLRFEMGRSTVVAGWAVMGIVLLWLGLKLKLADLRWQSYALAIAVGLRGVATRFEIPASDGGAPVRIAIAAVAIAALYIQEFLTPRDQPSRERYARPGYSLIATLLTAVLLYRDVSGSLLTVAWGIQGVLLLAAGFPLRERVLRLSGLCALLVCILKLFFHDLRHLETLPRILSFMALGFILMAVSWIYTRYRERLRRLL